MSIDEDRIDDAVLALMSLELEDHCRVWKGFNWGVLNRLHKKGMISNPHSKAKSVVLSEEGLRRSKELFESMFTRKA